MSCDITAGKAEAALHFPCGDLHKTEASAEGRNKSHEALGLQSNTIETEFLHLQQYMQLPFE